MKVEITGGTLTIGPGCAASECCSGSVDGQTSSDALCLRIEANATTGILGPRTISSPGAFVTLTGLGASDVVAAAEFLYVKTDAAMTLRLTSDDGSGGSVVETGPVVGLLLRRFPTANFLKLLEVKGSGRISYAVAGPR